MELGLVWKRMTRMKDDDCQRYLFVENCGKGICFGIQSRVSMYMTTAVEGM